MSPIFAMLLAMSQPFVIGHRGASGERPEHTRAAYELAFDQGADFIEPDLVPTKDGRLVARHENEISGTTDIADHPEFADRRTTKTIDGQALTGWFTEDFTLAELKTLRARERLPQLRPANTAWADERILTIDEVIAIAKARGRGVVAEIKHSAYFAGVGLPVERRLVDAFARAGWSGPCDPVWIESFEINNLVELSGLTKIRLVQLVDADTKIATQQGLKAISRYAQAVGAHKALVIPRDGENRSLPATTLVRDAHAAGLKVIVWTLRAENYFLPAELRKGSDPRAIGDAAAEARAFAEAGVDGIFTDHPATAVPKK